jgi:hypothetical protein
MKTYTIFGIMLVTGKQKELESVDKLAAGGYHVHKDPVRKKYPTAESFKEELTEAEVIRIAGQAAQKVTPIARPDDPFLRR